MTPGPAAPGRSVAFDHLRGLVVALVVLHHSVLAYCRFGHLDTSHYLRSTAPIVDADRWAGFDVLVLLNDACLMPLMFLLSGLFVAGSLQRRGRVGYAVDRLRRLALPFAVAASTVVPLAYFPAARLAGWQGDFPAFWFHAVTSGPWPSGPPWFVAVLFVLDLAALLVLPLIPGSFRGHGRRLFAWLWLASVLAYLPLLAAFSPDRWITAGPFAVQASRIGLYALYFAGGIALGRAGFRSGMLSAGSGVAADWPAWAGAALGSAVLLVLASVVRLVAPWWLPGWLWTVLVGLALLTVCAAATLALLAVSIRFARPRPVWDSLARNSYAIFLIHYPAVTWTQFGLQRTHGIPSVGVAVLKAALVFVVSLGGSWAGASLLRRIPAMARCI